MVLAQSSIGFNDTSEALVKLACYPEMGETLREIENRHKQALLASGRWSASSHDPDPEASFSGVFIHLTSSLVTIATISALGILQECHKVFLKHLGH